MPSYLLQLAYTAEAMAVMVKRPQNRAEAVKKPLEKLGGSMTGFWLAFGEYDAVGIIEMPDNLSAAAFAMALSAGGACRSLKTTPLIGIEEGLAAMEKAGTSGYKPATAKK
ncbi:GYD domain-containing protein [Acidicapsa acidisoli]|uniref:GYD domain-containing protein n=1 Tax=Acidicapsa acidisoli TaxID=1615681 RepID=UPI0021DF4CB7|nr:GYD domain-containing protein [Acidicapsa acidisoli]